MAASGGWIAVAALAPCASLARGEVPYTTDLIGYGRIRLRTTQASDGGERPSWTVRARRRRTNC